MKNQWVSELVANDLVTEHFFVQSAGLRQTKSGKNYVVLKLQDRTGTIEGRIWDVQQGPQVAVPSGFVKVQGLIEEYNDQLQVKVLKVRGALPDEIDYADYFPHSSRTPDEMWLDVWDLIDGHVCVDNFLCVLTRAVLEANRESYQTAPAGKSTHHAYYGGLMEHSISMAHAIVLISHHYGLDEPLMVSAALMHDIGKVRELTFTLGDGFNYSMDGNLLGHVSIGMEMISRTADAILPNNPRRKSELLHLVASHHGLLEWGSPKVPLMREAIAFHLIDMVDSKLGICDSVLKGDKTPGDFTAWVGTLGGPLLKPQQENEETRGTFLLPARESEVK